jgi:nodulation protein E
MRRVVITGAGTVNPLALDVPGTLAAMQAGHVAIAALDIPLVDRLSQKIGAQVARWDEEARFTRAEIALLDRYAQFAVVSAAQAVAQAGLTLTEDESLRAGVILGTSGGGLGTIDASYAAVYAEGRARVHPFTVPRLMPSAAAAHVGMRHGLRGPSFAVSSACASSNHALALAVQMIRAGAADVMLAGGAEAMLVFGGIKAWEGLRVMSPDGCRPFCATRTGMVQGEGAAVFVLESLARAQARGAHVLAEIAGVSMCADAGDIVLPDADGAARAMRLALAEAGVRPGYVNAHGTGTTANDRTESAAIRAVFGEVPMVSSTKSLHGHLIGAAGAVELLACLCALQGVAPPTAGFQRPDPDCLPDPVPNTAREIATDAVMSNAFAFGGMNACVVLKRV